jgi:hypothetical protein
MHDFRSGSHWSSFAYCGQQIGVGGEKYIDPIQLTYLDVTLSKILEKSSNKTTALFRDSYISIEQSYVCYLLQAGLFLG